MKTTTIWFLALLLIVGIASVSAFGGFWQGAQDRDAIRTAIQDKDFATWKTLMASQLTEENFNRLTELNHSRMRGNQAVFDAIEANDYDAWKIAIASTPRGEEMLAKIDADNFSKLVQMHESMQSGDIETAKSIAADLGISPGFQERGMGMENCQGNGRGRGMGRGQGDGRGNRMHNFEGD